MHAAPGIDGVRALVARTGGEVPASRARARWTNAETAALAAIYPAGGLKACMRAIPWRSPKAIYERAMLMGLQAPAWTDTRRGRRSTPWRGRLPIPPHCHPLVRVLVEEANAQMTTLQEIADRAGFRRGTVSGWRYTAMPRVADLEAALNVLGLELCVRRRQEARRPEGPTGREP